MHKWLETLDSGVVCCGWNYCGQRLVAGYIDGTVSIHDSTDPISAPSLTQSFRWKASEDVISNVIWVPPEYGDAITCVCIDGTVSLWEEVQTDEEPLSWKLCLQLEASNVQVLDLQLGFSSTSSLKMVIAYSDGHVKIYEFLDPLDLKKAQLQAEFSNVIDSLSNIGKPSCLSASIAWNPRRDEIQQSTFVLGFSADLPQFNSAKIWEFDEAHQRWLPVAELALPEDKGNKVQSLAWAPNIGRPYEIIAVATWKGIAIWHVDMNSDSSSEWNSCKKVALLSDHDSEVWQLEWDMSGMTLASTGGDGMVRLWQSNLNGVWHEQAAIDCGAVQQ